MASLAFPAAVTEMPAPGPGWRLGQRWTLRLETPGSVGDACCAKHQSACPEKEASARSANTARRMCETPLLGETWDGSYVPQRSPSWGSEEGVQTSSLDSSRSPRGALE